MPSTPVRSPAAPSDSSACVKTVGILLDAGKDGFVLSRGPTTVADWRRIEGITFEVSAVAIGGPSQGTRLRISFTLDYICNNTVEGGSRSTGGYSH